MSRQIETPRLTFIFFVGASTYTRIVTHPKTQRFRLLAQAVLFNVILIAVDIASDIATAVKLLTICSKYNSCTDATHCQKLKKSLDKIGKGFCGIASSYNGWLDGISLPVFWSLLTLTPIFVPLLARVVVTCAMLTRCFKVRGRCGRIEKIPGRLMIWFEELKQLPWHFPMLQPIRYRKKPILT